jgi:hypothetical protein
MLDEIFATAKALGIKPGLAAAEHSPIIELNTAS